MYLQKALIHANIQLSQLCSVFKNCHVSLCYLSGHGSLLKNTKNKKQKYILGAINLGYPIQCEVLKGPPPSGCEVMDLWSFLRKAPKTPLKIWTEKIF